MKTLIAVMHDIRTNTIEVTYADDDGDPVAHVNYKALHKDVFEADAGEHAQKYIDLAGWTPEYIAGVKAAEEAEAKTKQDQADAEAAEADAKREAADKEAFDADVARQVAILEAAQAIVGKKK